jgi:hypothetical protein
MTECSQSEFEFKGHFSRRAGGAFDGGTMTIDGGALLLREADRRLNLLPGLAECFLDRRNPVLVTHSVAKMVAQRVYGLAPRYEDLNDHEPHAAVVAKAEHLDGKENPRYVVTSLPPEKWLAR